MVPWYLTALKLIKFDTQHILTRKFCPGTHSLFIYLMRKLELVDAGCPYGKKLFGTQSFLVLIVPEPINDKYQDTTVYPIKILVVIGWSQYIFYG